MAHIELKALMPKWCFEIHWLWEINSAMRLNVFKDLLCHCKRLELVPDWAVDGKVMWISVIS